MTEGGLLVNGNRSGALAGREHEVKVLVFVFNVGEIE